MSLADATTGDLLAEVARRIDHAHDDVKVDAAAPDDRVTHETLFNFEDGNGPVPAHRHINPDGEEGGWVSGTAQVSDNAWVFGNAQVSEGTHDGT